MSVLDATWIDEKDLKRAVSSIKKFVPSVLVTTEDQFNGYAYAFNIHRMVGLKKIFTRARNKKDYLGRVHARSQF